MTQNSPLKIREKLVNSLLSQYKQKILEDEEFKPLLQRLLKDTKKKQK
jgi:hypothetical protein